MVTSIEAKPECSYCDATTGLRIKCDGGLSAFGFQLASTEYTCEACFVGSDDGPSFDDLKPAWPKREDGSNMTIGEMSSEDRRAQMAAANSRVMHPSQAS